MHFTNLDTGLSLTVRTKISHKKLLTSWIMSMSSASVGFCPRDRITVPSSFVVMVPVESQSEGRNETLLAKQTSFHSDK